MKPEITAMALWHNWRVARSLSPQARQEARQMIHLIACAAGVEAVRFTARGMLRKLERDGLLFGSAA